MNAIPMQPARLDKAGVVGLPAELALLDKKGAPLLDELTRLAAATELLVAVVELGARPGPAANCAQSYWS